MIVINNKNWINKIWIKSYHTHKKVKRERFKRRIDSYQIAQSIKKEKKV